MLVSLKHLESWREKRTKRLETIFNFRLAVAVFGFVGMTALLILGAGTAQLIVLVLLVLSFLVLWIISEKTRFLLAECSALIEIHERQNARFRGHELPMFAGAKSVGSLSDLDREIVADLDLLGPHSLLAYLSDSYSENGEQLVLRWLLDAAQGKVTVKTIESRKEWIQRLTRFPGACLRGLARGRSLSPKGEWEKNLGNLSQLIASIKVTALQNTVFFLTLLMWLVAIVSVFLKPGLEGQVFRQTTYGLFVVANLIGNFVFSREFKSGLEWDRVIGQLLPMLRFYEKFAESCKLEGPFRTLSDSKISVDLVGIRKWTSFLSVSANPLVFFILNLLSPWTVVFSWLLLRSSKKAARGLTQAIDATYEAEALMSAALYAVSRPCCFAEITNQMILEFQEMNHPLIGRQQSVPNSFSMGALNQVTLLTGSNMAGKSTFMRALGLNFVLANAGLPVCSKKARVFKGTLRSCMRVSDSVRDGFSYFYAEVRRLKSILDQVHGNEPVLVLIDELFRGTNNRERLIGARSLILDLVKAKSGLTIVASHDLELTRLEQEVGNLKNFHFKESVSGTQMAFTYLIEAGPCPTTNALIIMKNIGLPIV